MVDVPGKANLRDNTVSHIINHTQITHQELGERRHEAALRDWFLEQDAGVIRGVLTDDLKKFVDTADISRMKLITLDQFLAAFMQNLLHVYDTAPALTSADTGENGKETEDMTRLRKLLDEVDYVQVMRSNLIQARLHNVALAEVKYNTQLERLFVQTGYNIGNSWVVQYESFWLEWEVFAYEVWIKGKETKWIVWDRGATGGPEHYVFICKDSMPKFEAGNEKRLTNGIKEPIPGNEDFKAPDFGGDQSAPIVTCRYERHNDFWGNGLNALVELIRAVNILLTVVNDDTIQETIRLLILNFEPGGTEGEKGQLKAGLRHPLIPVSAAPGSQQAPTAEVVSADLYNSEVLELVEKLLDITTNMFDVENPIRSDLEASLSGIALRLRAEPLIQNWREDILRVRKPDMELLRALINVNNLNRGENQINPKVLDGLSMDYVEPNVVKDEAGEYALEKQRWQDGMSNPVAWVMRNNPEMSEAQAKQFIETNQEITRQLKGQPLVLRTDPGLETTT